MSIEAQCHFFTIYFPGFVCFVLYKAKISGERLQDHWSSGFRQPLQVHCGTLCIGESQSKCPLPKNNGLEARRAEGPLFFGNGLLRGLSPT